MTGELTVYSYRRCPFAMRVRIALHEKGLAFKVVEEDLKNFSEELLTHHPEAKVPVLLHEGQVIYESAIITEYIEERFPEKTKLMPNSAAAKAEVRLWTYWCNQIFKPDLDRFKYGKSRFDESECVGIEEKLLKHLEKLEQRLASHLWLVGEDFSLADIHIFPFVRQLSRVTPAPAFLPGFCALKTWQEKIAQRPSIIKTLEK